MRNARLEAMPSKTFVRDQADGQQPWTWPRIAPGRFASAWREREGWRRLLHLLLLSRPDVPSLRGQWESLPGFSLRSVGPNRRTAGAGHRGRLVWRQPVESASQEFSKL